MSALHKFDAGCVILDRFASLSSADDPVCAMTGVPTALLALLGDLDTVVGDVYATRYITSTPVNSVLTSIQLG